MLIASAANDSKLYEETNNICNIYVAHKHNFKYNWDRC